MKKSRVPPFRFRVLRGEAFWGVVKRWAGSMIGVWIGRRRRCILDSEAEATRYINDVKRDIQRMFSPAIIQQAHRQIEMAAASPGLLEVALLDRMIDLIVDAERTYDLIVFDTAPTGHTLQLLRMPDAMTAWIQALVRHRRAVVEIDRGTDQTQEQAEAADPVLAALTRRHERLARLRATIMDRSRTTFALVTIPERLAIEETARAAELLDDQFLIPNS